MRIKTLVFKFSKADELAEFLSTNPNQSFYVKRNSAKMCFEVYADEEVTEPEFNIANLSEISHDNELTMEQANAIDYGISAIKTLVDMGVLK